MLHWPADLHHRVSFRRVWFCMCTCIVRLLRRELPFIELGLQRFHTRLQCLNMHGHPEGHQREPGHRNTRLLHLKNRDCKLQPAISETGEHTHHQAALTLFTVTPHIARRNASYNFGECQAALFPALSHTPKEGPQQAALISQPLLIILRFQAATESALEVGLTRSILLLPSVTAVVVALTILIFLIIPSIYMLSGFLSEWHG
jgi:hypothetical protein